MAENELEYLYNNTQSEFWSSSNANFELHKEEPIFEGQYSNESYKERIFEALDNFLEHKKVNVYDEWELF